MKICFKKKLNNEQRKFSLELLDEYETACAMTKSERQELYQWVAEENSPYDNPSLIYGENGKPMDDISTLREEEYLRQMYENMSAEERTRFHREREDSEDESLLNDVKNLTVPFM